MIDINQTDENTADGMSPLLSRAIDKFRQENVGRVLDLGCGDAKKTIILANHGFNVVGIDMFDEVVMKAKREVNRSGIKNLVIVKADMRSIPDASNSFDAVFAHTSIDHNRVDGIKQTISEVRRVLKPGGIFIATVLSRRDPRFETGDEIEPGTRKGINDYDFEVPHHFFTEEEAREMFSDFEIAELNEREYERNGQSEKFNIGICFDLVMRKP